MNTIPEIWLTGELDKDMEQLMKLSESKTLSQWQKRHLQAEFFRCHWKVCIHQQMKNTTFAMKESLLQAIFSGLIMWYCITNLEQFGIAGIAWVIGAILFLLGPCAGTVLSGLWIVMRIIMLRILPKLAPELEDHEMFWGEWCAEKAHDQKNIVGFFSLIGVPIVVAIIVMGAGR